MSGEGDGPLSPFAIGIGKGIEIEIGITLSLIFAKGLASIGKLGRRLALASS